MLKKSIIIVLSAFFLFSCQLVPRPKKNSEVGAVIGKFEIILVKNFLGLKPGVRNRNITLRLHNKVNKKAYLIKTVKGGYYTFLNIPPGTYGIEYFYYEEEQLGEEIGLNGTIEFPPIVVKANQFITINNIRAKAEPHKAQFISKGKFDLIFTSEDVKELKEHFSSLDEKNFWKDFQWNRQKEDVEENIVRFTNYEKIDLFKTVAHKDKESMEKLLKVGEYYLALLKAYDVIKVMLDAYYLKITDSATIPKSESVLELSRRFDSKLSGDHTLLLVDLADFYARSKQDYNEEEYKRIFTKDYVEDYVDKINEFKRWLEGKLKE